MSTYCSYTLQSELLLCRTCAHSFMEFETGSDRHHRPFVCQRFTMRSIESVYINNARRGCYFYCRHNSMNTQKESFWGATQLRHSSESVSTCDNLKFLAYHRNCVGGVRSGCLLRQHWLSVFRYRFKKKSKRECLLLCGCCFYFKCRHRRCSYREYRERADQIPA